MTASAEPAGAFPALAPAARHAPFRFLGGRAGVQLTGAQTGNRPPESDRAAVMTRAGAFRLRLA